MKQKNLEVINTAFRYKSIRQIRCGKELLHGGKVHHNCVGISGEIEKKQGRKLDPRITSQIICRGKKDIRKGLRSGQFLKGKFIPLTREEHDKYMKLEDAQARADFIKDLKRKGWKRYDQTNRVLGNVFGEGGFNNLSKEVWRLALAGENLEDHSRNLCRKYRLPVDCIKDQWDEDQEYFEKLPAQEIEALRNQEYLKPLTKKERQSWKESQAKNRYQEKIRRAAISA